MPHSYGDPADGHSSFRTLGVAFVYFHIFYMRRSFQKWDSYLVGVTCIFLATKAEEWRISADQLLQVYWKHVPDSRKGGQPDIPSPDSSLHIQTREDMFNMELILMDVIEYRFEVPRSHRQLLPALDFLFGPEYANIDPQWYQNNVRDNQSESGLRLAKHIWYYINDSLYSRRLCLRYAPGQILVACIYRSLKDTNIQLLDARTALQPGSRRGCWTEVVFGVPEATVLQICAELRDQISYNLKVSRKMSVGQQQKPQVRQQQQQQQLAGAESLMQNRPLPSSPPPRSSRSRAVYPARGNTHGNPPPPPSSSSSSSSVAQPQQQQAPADHNSNLVAAAAAVGGSARNGAAARLLSNPPPAQGEPRPRGDSRGHSSSEGPERLTGRKRPAAPVLHRGGGGGGGGEDSGTPSMLEPLASLGRDGEPQEPSPKKLKPLLP